MIIRHKSIKSKEMLVANLYFLKETNGMYYYCRDYMASTTAQSVIIAKPRLANKIRGDWQNWRKNIELVEVGNVASLALLAYLYASTRAFIFTPTPHPMPIPGIKQLIVVHDDYPFKGSHLAKLKRFMLAIALRVSNSKVGYINKSCAKGFAETLVPGKLKDTYYMPNAWPSGEPAAAEKLSVQDRKIILGMTGTDSLKKRHELIIREIIRQGKSQRYYFKIYGHANDYTRLIEREFKGKVEIEIVDSDKTSLAQYLATIDAIACASLGEGFSRPIAYALTQGIKCYLLSDAVFEEFYGEISSLHDSVSDLVNALITSGGCGLQNIQLQNKVEARRKETEQSFVKACQLLDQYHLSPQMEE